MLSVSALLGTGTFVTLYAFSLSLSRLTAEKTKKEADKRREEEKHHLKQRSPDFGDDLKRGLASGWCNEATERNRQKPRKGSATTNEEDSRPRH